MATKSILHCADVAHGADIGHCRICSVERATTSRISRSQSQGRIPESYKRYLSQTTNACQSYTRNNTGLIVVTYNVDCLETNARANSATLKPNFFMPCTYPDANICFSV
jgi:hypothetical protein